MSCLQQGQADGLCGIYSLLNFLQTTDWEEENSSDGLKALLECADRFGWFTPHYITEGFEDYQLKRILDYQIEAYRLPFQTAFVLDTFKSSRYPSFVKLAEAVAKQDGSLIASKSRRDHWVLLTPRLKKMWVIDSSNSNSEQQLPLKTSGYDKEFGLIITPAEPCRISWNDQ